MAKLVAKVLLLCATGAAGLADSDFKERPVMKVVRLLQDMKAELQKDLDDDKAVHEQLACWCKTNDREKTAAIEAGDQKVTALEAFLGEAKAKMDELKTKRDETLDEVNRDEAALQQASTLRMKDNKVFHGEQMNLIEAIKALDQALVVLGKHNTGLAQVKQIAQQLQHAQVFDLARKTSPVPASDMLALRTFLLKAQGATSFLQVPGFQSYSPQSSQIFGVLGQMKEDFEKDLAEAEAKEKKDAEDFAELKAAKKDEIGAGRKLVAELDQQIAELKEKHAQAFKELEDTKEQLDIDRTFLANLKKKCAASDEEFDQRVKDRLEEISAVEDTIKILNDDAAFESFDKTVNSFVQTSSSSDAQERLRRATAVLVRAAAATGTPELGLLASRAQLDAFSKVKEEIDKMVVQLKKQQEDEIAHRDWCIEELNTNKHDTEEGYDTKAALETKIADLEKTIEYLTKEIDATTQAVAEMQEQMKRASETREAENADFQQTVADQRLTQMILAKALKRMQQVYYLIQAPGGPHIETSGTHTDPGNGPAAFKDNAAKHAGGSRVVGLIQEVIADSKKTEDEAIRSEQDGQSAYENFMIDSNRAITTYSEKLANMKGSLAQSNEDHALAKKDHKATMTHLSELNDESGNLHKSCDFIKDTFDARQAARTAEIDALVEAKGILSGMK
mmetsp:Transcript_56852/g.184178  ORF Transcript_56852/g.184178 Transcript_56852/m.184178 type:complete len:677 (-) Transcript_56852:78-2108(-)